MYAIATGKVEISEVYGGLHPDARRTIGENCLVGEYHCRALTAAYNAQRCERYTYDIDKDLCYVTNGNGSGAGVYEARSRETWRRVGYIVCFVSAAYTAAEQTAFFFVKSYRHACIMAVAFVAGGCMPFWLPDYCPDDEGETVFDVMTDVYPPRRA